MDPLASYLVRRVDRPFAWLTMLGAVGLIFGSLSGYVQSGFEGMLVLGFVGGVVAGTVGLGFGIFAWLVSRLMGGLDRRIKRTEQWTPALECPACGWCTTPDGPWTVRDCLAPPRACPNCQERLGRKIPICPCCGVCPKGPIRWPRSFRQAFWGGYTCWNCSCDYDKWGRQHESSATTELASGDD